MADGRLPRLTWCATGPLTFLPLHAAGLYDTASLLPPTRVFDFVVSSYTPSLSALLPRDTIDRRLSDDNLRILAVSQPATPDQFPIPATRDEVLAIEQCVGNITWLDHKKATVDAVVSAMDQHNI